MLSPDLEIPKQFAALSGFGKPIEVFIAKSSLIFYIILAAAFFLTSGGLLIYTLYRFYTLWTDNYYPPVIFSTLLPWLLALARTMFFTLLMLWQICTSRKKAAVVFEDGFACSDFKGNKNMEMGSKFTLSLPRWSATTPMGSISALCTRIPWSVLPEKNW